MKKALRILLRQGATLIAPLGDTDTDVIPTIEEVQNLVMVARQNDQSPWVTLNTMETKVLADEITAFSVITVEEPKEPEVEPTEPPAATQPVPSTVEIVSNSAVSSNGGSVPVTVDVEGVETVPVQ